MLAFVVAAKVVRSFGYGLLSVAFALYLASAGFGAVAIGATLSLALIAGAFFLTLSATFVRKVGSRTTLIIAALAMCAAGAILSLHDRPLAIVIACLFGTLSAGGQEVGPFAAIEQHAIAESTGSDKRAHAFANYNLAGAFALAFGALAAGAISTPSIPWAYALCGIIIAALYAAMPVLAPPPAATPTADAGEEKRIRFGNAEKLAALFGLDALAGGFVVQSFLAYWLHVRYGADQQSLAVVLFAANTLSALSYPVAARLSTKIGLLRTMVFTHLPSNVLLCIVPLMPTFEGAAAVLIARFALSQMDVPTRQAFAMGAVPPSERVHAAALTNAVRPAAAAVAPIFSGLSLATAAIGVPFFIAGGLKIIYDLTIFNAFKRLRETSG
ncbi:MAG TPA: MFS transporter [Candidatus Eremiobacteraceae bacterium]|nr:MFS transporter [Candidatus Eremiobacteraceae bacterium]